MSDGPPTMLVVCETPSHPKKRCKVASFERPDHTRHWVPDVDALGPGVSEQALVDNVPTADPWVGGTRRRYSLSCKLCALKVDLKDDRLQVIFNELSAAGRTSVSLDLLAAASARRHETPTDF